MLSIQFQDWLIKRHPDLAKLADLLKNRQSAEAIIQTVAVGAADTTAIKNLLTALTVGPVTAQLAQLILEIPDRPGLMKTPNDATSELLRSEPTDSAMLTQTGEQYYVDKITELDQRIREKLKTQDRVVVFIFGYPGSGKTPLAKAIAEHGIAGVPPTQIDAYTEDPEHPGPLRTYEPSENTKIILVEGFYGIWFLKYSLGLRNGQPDIAVLLETGDREIETRRIAQKFGDRQRAEKIYARFNLLKTEYIKNWTMTMNPLNPAIPVQKILSKVNADSAMLASTQEHKSTRSREKAPGGIDLTADSLPIETTGEGVTFTTPSIQELESMTITGFTPVIIDILPMPSIPIFLGLNELDPAIKEEELLVSRN